MNIELHNSESAHISQMVQPTNDDRIFEIDGDGDEGRIVVTLTKRRSLASEAEYMVATSAVEYTVDSDGEEGESVIDVPDALEAIIRFDATNAHYTFEDGKILCAVIEQKENGFYFYPLYFRPVGGGIPRPVIVDVVRMEK